MFKEAITAATNKTFSGLKKSGSYVGGLVLQEGAAAIARRSPMLGGFADKVINNIQANQQLNKIRTASAKNYIETADNDTSKEFKEKIKSESGAGASDKAIEKDMVNILTKLQKLVDKNGQEETKKSEFYKTYEKYFEDYKKHEEQAIKESNKEKTTDETSVTAENTTNVTNSVNQLDNIETNTKDTVETLTKLIESPAKTKTPNGIMPALDQLGGQLIEKIFTEKLLKKDKNVEKADDDLKASPTEVVADASKETLIEVKKTNEFLSIQNIKDEERSVSEKETLAETRRNNITVILDVLGERLGTSISDLGNTLKAALEVRADPIQAEVPDLDIDVGRRSNPKKYGKGKQKKRPTRARSLSPVADKIASVAKAESIVPDLSDAAKKPSAVSGGRFSSLLSGAGRVAGAVAPYAMPALALGAAGAVGYGAGTLLNSGISAGLSSLTGSETTLGGYLYDKLGGDDATKDITKPVSEADLAAYRKAKGITPKQTATVAPVRSSSATVAATSAALNSKEAATAKPAAPIIVTNNNNMTSGVGGGGGSVIAASPVRNTESTFERVQMQDFWPRAA